MQTKQLISSLMLALLSTTLSQPALAQDAAIKVLIEQGRYWSSQNRPDRAADAWSKLLRLQPDNPEALAGMVQFELDNNRQDTARSYFTRLREKHPNYAGIKKLEEAVLYRTSDKQVLEQARQQAQTGQSEQALTTYKQVFGSKVPQSGPLALEYYQTLGGSAAGWEEARKGLERLQKENPGNPKYELAYAQHLSYRESTRREAIRLLAALAKKESTAKAATESWRKSLIWLDARRADENLFEAYLAVESKDEAILNRLEVLRNPPKVEVSERDQSLNAAFNALNKGDLGRAAAQFEAILQTKPNDADALGGLGVIRLKQQRFTEAESLLSRAQQQGSSKKWAQPLASARFWGLITRADSERRQGNDERAKGLYLQAAQLDNTQLLPLLNVADLYLDDGQYAQAEQIYRRARERHPDNLQAIRGLLSALTLQEKHDEAIRIAEGLTESQREKMGGFGQIRAQQLRALARASDKRGDIDLAMQYLEDAILWDPDDAWSRLDLARLYQKLNAPTQARAVVDGLLISHPDLPEALQASAILSAESKDWTEGLYTLEKIPANVRTKEMAQLQRRLWINAQLERANLALRDGQLAVAQQIVRQVEPVAGKEVEYLGLLAGMYAEMGDEARALATMRSLMGQSLRIDPGLRVQYAAILLKTRQDAELVAQLRQLYSLPLSEQQRADLDNIRIAYTLRQADTLREAGQYAAAYEVLAPVVAESPDEPRLQQGLARLYVSAGDYTEGLRWYEPSLIKEPNNLDARVAFAGAALADKRLKLAAETIDTALRQAPSNPRVLAMAGRIARAQGLTQKAAEYYRAALAAERSSSGSQGGALGMRFVDYRLPATTIPTLSGEQALTYAQAAANSKPYIPSPLLNQTNTVPPASANPASRNTGPAAIPGMPLPTVKREMAPVIPIQPVGQRPESALPKPIVPQSFDTAPSQQSSGIPGAPARSLPNAFYPRQSSSATVAEPPAHALVRHDPLMRLQQALVSKATVHTPAPAMHSTPATPVQREQVSSAVGVSITSTPPRATSHAEIALSLQPAQQPAVSAPARAERLAEPTAVAARGSNGLQLSLQLSLPASALPTPVAERQIAQTAVSLPPAGLAAPASTGSATALSAWQEPTLLEKQTQAQVQSTATPLTLAANISAPRGLEETLAQANQTSRIQPGSRFFVATEPRQLAGPAVSPAPAALPAPVTPASPVIPAAPVRIAPAQRQFQPAPAAIPAIPAPVMPGMSYTLTPLTPTLPNSLQPLPKRQDSVADELADIEAKRAGSFSGGVYARSRTGEAGLGQLYEVQTPLEARFPIGYEGHLALRLAPTLLDAGSLNFNNPARATRFGVGTGSLGNIGSRSINASGVGMGLAYEGERLGVDIGTTPLGFEVVDATGGIRWRDRADRLNYAVEVSQRPVTDSVLSYAGIKDPVSGRIWGGVRASGVRLDLNYELGRSGVYGFGGYHLLTGRNVADNTRFEFGGGAYHKVMQKIDEEFTVGFNVNFLTYEKNLSYYTFGHGGYFSPQRYLSITAPMDYSGRSGRLAYQLRGAIGLQTFTQDAASYFPTEGSLQAGVDGVAAANPSSGIKTRYDGQTKTGLAFNIAGRAEYQLAPKVFVGGYAGFDNAINFRESAGMVYVRYLFAPSYTPVSFPPRGLRPYY
ncbi:cellulose biosynthesis protein BcsC [Parvibium lacunae]|uniref:Cellulose synthase operon C C-terminal domain-containing protein n=1 Tax=Parvibium lacunae TaxID=1888893 RepID=A0A368L874_9BURK|nr:cellulose biosynthesis protein BcsC [Parvibium lacunae]RCS59804.1 hypothetical protein DU000_03625 [Parvibium lacunae]